MTNLNGAIKIVTNDTGYAKRVQTREGMTVGEVFAVECGYEDDSKYTILLNGEPTTKEEVVHDNDVIVITPKNLKGN